MYIKILKPIKITHKQFFSLHNQVLMIDIINDNKDCIRVTSYANESSNLNTMTDGNASMENNNNCNIINSDTNGKINNMPRATTYTSYDYYPSDSPVLIGRSKSNTLTISNSSLSKKHCSLIFNKSEKVWEISDGVNGKSSLNGTWLVNTSSYEISALTIFKVGDASIKVNLY